MAAVLIFLGSLAGCFKDTLQRINQRKNKVRSDLGRTMNSSSRENKFASIQFGANTVSSPSRENKFVSIPFGAYTVSSPSRENKFVSVPFGAYTVTSPFRDNKFVYVPFWMYIVNSPGSVAQKMVYFEQYYKKFRPLKGLDQEDTNQQPQSHSSTEGSNEVDFQHSNEIQTPIQESGSHLDNSVVEEENDMREVERSNKIEEPVPVVPPPPVVLPVRLVHRKSMEKLAHAFDSLSKDWVKLKKDIALNRRNKRAQSENTQNLENPKHGMTRISTTGTKSRPGTPSSCNKPKSSIGTRRVVPITSGDSCTGSREVISVPSRSVSKLSSNSSLYHKKKQRQVRPAWR